MDHTRLYFLGTLNYKNDRTLCYFYVLVSCNIDALMHMAGKK